MDSIYIYFFSVRLGNVKVSLYGMMQLYGEIIWM